MVCAGVKNSGPALFKVGTGKAGFWTETLETLYPERKCVVKLDNVLVDSSDMVGKYRAGGEIRRCGYGEDYLAEMR